MLGTAVGFMRETGRCLFVEFLVIVTAAQRAVL
jgi:hypothetical protein